MKKCLSIVFLGVTLISYSQNDNIPFATKTFLKNDPTWNQSFSSPSSDYTKIDALKNNSDIIKELYKPLDGVKKLRVYNKRLKILTEGFADVLSNYKFASPFVAMGKEYLFQKAEEAVESKIQIEKSKFNNSIKSAFNSSVSMELKNNPELSYKEAVENFSKQLDSFSTSLNPKDYRILAPIVDQQSLKFIRENRVFFEQKFKEQKEDINKILSKTKGELFKDFDSKMLEFKKSLDDFDKKLLSGIKENAESLKKFNQQVEKKFQKLDEDVKEMRSSIIKNKQQIANNNKRIEKNRNKIALVSKLQAQNASLISENSFKIGVITDVLYDNADTKGKIKILDLKFKNDTNNPAYLETKNILENINSVQNIQSYLSGAGDIVELATNLGLSKQDAENANQAIAIGNVIVNGAMAYFTGNPIAGIQAVNGAFALFGGGNGGDPQFDAIMAEFAQINKKLDEMNKKLDVINDNILDLRKLNVDLYIENQKRFTRIDEKLITIENKLDRLTQLIYSDNEALKINNIAQYSHLWEGIRGASSLKKLRDLYESSQEVKDIVKIVYLNTKNKSLSSKKFLHFNRFEKDNNWENKIYKPLIGLINQLYPDLSFNNLEFSIVNLNDNTLIPRLNVTYNENDIFKKNLPLPDFLIYPQSIITITEFTDLVEPYLYFYKDPNDNNFNIPEEISVDASIKNKSTKIKFQNILKENRTAIAQANIISGAILLPYFKKHILERGYNISHKRDIHNLLTSQNEYLKLNLSNYLINTELTLPSQIEKFYSIQKEINFDKVIELVDEVNNDLNFENPFFKLNVIGSKTNFRTVITIKPMNVDGVDDSKKSVNLAIPPFEYLLEKKILYPEYLQALFENQNLLINKIAKYDIIERVYSRPEYKNYINLN